MDPRPAHHRALQQAEPAKTLVITGFSCRTVTAFSGYQQLSTHTLPGLAVARHRPHTRWSQDLRAYRRRAVRRCPGRRWQLTVSTSMPTTCWVSASLTAPSSGAFPARMVRRWAYGSPTCQVVTIRPRAISRKARWLLTSSLTCEGQTRADQSRHRATLIREVARLDEHCDEDAPGRQVSRRDVSGASADALLGARTRLICSAGSTCPTAIPTRTTSTRKCVLAVPCCRRGLATTPPRAIDCATRCCGAGSSAPVPRTAAKT